MRTGPSGCGRRAETAATAFAEPLGVAIHRVTNLDMIEIAGKTVVAHKKFDGSIKLADGSADAMAAAGRSAASSATWPIGDGAGGEGLFE